MLWEEKMRVKEYVVVKEEVGGDGLWCVIWGKEEEWKRGTVR